MNGQCFNHLFYADDTVLLAPTVNGLQSLIDICKRFGDFNDITYNFKKSVCSAFMPKTLAFLNIPSVFLGSSMLDFIDVNKYLGIIIDADGTDDNDITRLTRSLYCNGNLLTKRFLTCGVNVKVKLFQTFCYSLYGTHLWHTYSAGQYRRCTVAYNDIFRKLFGYRRGDSISAATASLHVDTFNVVRRRLIYSFIKRIFKSHNQLICTIRDSVYFLLGSSTMTEWSRSLLIKT